MALQFDYFKTVVTGTCLGVEWQNQWWHTVQVDPGGLVIAPILASEIGTIYDQLTAVTSADFTVDLVETVEWKRGTEIGSDSPATVGSVAAETMPEWFRYSISYERTAVGRNYPQKRIPGVPVGAVDNGNVLATYVDALEDFAEDMRVIGVAAGIDVLMFVVKSSPPLGTQALDNTTIYKIMYPPGVRDVKFGTQRN